MTAYQDGQLVELVRGVAALPAGTRGVIVGVYGNGGYEMEIIGDSDAVNVVTVGQEDLRPVD